MQTSSEEQTTFSVGLLCFCVLTSLSAITFLIFCQLWEEALITTFLCSCRDGDRGEGGSALYSRLPLLVSCYRGNKDALETVVRHLTSHKRSVNSGHRDWNEIVACSISLYTGTLFLPDSCLSSCTTLMRGSSSSMTAAPF